MERLGPTTQLRALTRDTEENGRREEPAEFRGIGLATVATITRDTEENGRREEPAEFLARDRRAALRVCGIDMKSMNWQED